MQFRSILSAFILTLAAAAPSFGIVPVPTPSIPTRLPNTLTGRPAYTPGQLTVRLKRGADVDRFYAETGLAHLKSLPEIRTEVVGVPAGMELDTVQLLSQRSDVEYAERDGRAYAMKAPNDTYYAQRKAGDPYQWYLPQIQAPGAWDFATGDSSVVIAVLDTGIDLTHPDLKGKVVKQVNEVANNNDAQDDEGHGSHVSGLAAASSNNGGGIAGVSWGAKIMPVKVLDSSGSGADSDIAAGLIYAAKNGAKVINMSLGSPSNDSTLLNAVNYAHNQGCLLLAAAGNEAQEGNPIDYPAAYANVMAIGASNELDQRSYFSQIQNYVSVVAPGGSATSGNDSNMKHWILSTFLMSEGGYQMEAGTSQATPIVSGLAALLWSIRPDYTAAQIRQAIESTAVDVAPAGKDKNTGYGRVNASASVQKLLNTSDTTPPAVSITFPAAGAYLTGAVSIKGSVDDPALQSFQVQYGSGAAPASWTNIGSPVTQSVKLNQLASWDTEDLPEGVYSLRVVATDLSGNVTDTSVTTPLSVTLDHTPPTVALTQPLAGQTLSGDKPVLGKADDAIAFQSYSLDLGAGTDPDKWTNIASDTTAHPTADTLGQLSFSGVKPGPYTLRLTASDQAGNTSKTVVHFTYALSTLGGDVNKDGQINVSDAILILRMSVGLQSPTTAELVAADVAPYPGTGNRTYGDGQITVADAIRVLLKALGLETGVWPG